MNRKSTTVRFQPQRWEAIERAAAARGMRATEYVARAAEELALRDDLLAYRGTTELQAWNAAGAAETADQWSRLG